MAVRQNVLAAEIEEQRCLIEQQQVEILRQRHQLEMQRRHLAHLEAELEAIKVTAQGPAPTIDPAHPARSNGNGHHRVPPLSGEARASTD